MVAEHLGSDPRSVIEAAKAAKAERDKLVDQGLEDKFDEIWVVFDTEGPQNVQRTNEAKNALEQARALNFEHAVSNPCFEFWLLLHFEWNVGPFQNCSVVCSRLRRHIAGYTKAINPYDDTRPLTQTAQDNARRLLTERFTPGTHHPCDCHPSTHVHKLIESLLGLA